VYDDLPWLDLVLHLRLHSLTHPQRNVAQASKEAAPRAASLNTYATVKFLFWRKAKHIGKSWPGKCHFSGVWASTLS
jgi:hypothetical protein